MHLRPARRLLLTAGLAAALAAPAFAPGTAAARDGDRGRDRVEVRTTGTCGRSSAIRLRLRAEDGRIRIDTTVRTARTGRWRLTVLHERRVVAKLRVRATRAARGFERRVTVRDWSGADAVVARAVSPAGETCTAGATVRGS
ncbi:MAG TPA: hypothetical protein VFG74_03780 [Miltoncostaeaceae bacterium]|nr:hypothetical protein [Miltoncostaeaceae bacterium]